MFVRDGLGKLPHIAERIEEFEHASAPRHIRGLGGDRAIRGLAVVVTCREVVDNQTEGHSQATRAGLYLALPLRVGERHPDQRIDDQIHFAELEDDHNRLSIGVGHGPDLLESQPAVEPRGSPHVADSKPYAERGRYHLTPALPLMSLRRYLSATWPRATSCPTQFDQGSASGRSELVARGLASAVHEIEVLRSAVAEFARRVEVIAEGQLDLATQCEDWTVRDLVEHVLGGNRLAVALLDGASGEQAVARVASHEPAGEPETEPQRTAEAMPSPFSQLDALERVCDHPADSVTGRAFAVYRAGDIVVHAWDLARTIGADETALVDAINNTQQERDVAREELQRSPARVPKRTGSKQGMSEL